MALDCWTSPDDADALDLIVVAKPAWATWLAERPALERGWLEAMGFEPNPGSLALLPAPDGAIAAAVMIVGAPASPFDVAAARQSLPAKSWRLVDPLQALSIEVAAEGWGLASYAFAGYGRKAAERNAGARLAIDLERAGRGAILAEAVALGRDLVNRPANRLGPDALHEEVEALAERRGARFRAIVGEDLLEEGFPAIHAVGRAADQDPRLLDLSWGDDPEAPLFTLIGKGVCFDTGGLDIKPVSAMALMKKDMGGAGVMIALADAIMASNWPVRLRLLVPAVENSISDEAFRPGDVIESRKGLSIEIGNTDAEGRLVLADALALACEEDEPALILDAATLTGAARAALGADIPALFCNDDALARAIETAARATEEPIWRMPLHQPYRKIIESPIADLNNAGSKPMGGAITAALFLESFVAKGVPWAHLDIYAHNPENRPGRPRGGEATALRALYAMLEAKAEARR